MIALGALRERTSKLRIEADGLDAGRARAHRRPAVRVAAEARVLLEELGYAGFPKTSGGRGVHVDVRIEPRWTFTDVRHAAIAFGRELERRLPGQVTTKWWKEERGAPRRDRLCRPLAAAAARHVRARRGR